MIGLNSLGGNTTTNPDSLKASNDMAAAWASLADNSNELFNPKPQSSPNNTQSKPELSPDEKEKLGRKLRKELLETAELASKKQSEAYKYLYESLSNSGYNALATTVDGFRKNTVDLDAGRIKSLIDYIDLKFTSGPGVDKSRAEARENYQKASVAYAGKIEKSLEYAGRGLLLSSGETASCLLKLRKTLPESQLATSKELIEYFDNPSEEAKKQLKENLTGHDNLIGKAFHSLTKSTEEEMPRSSGISDTVYKIGATTRGGHEGLYGALIDYYEFKKDNHQGDKTVESQSSQTFQPNNPTVNRPTGSKMMSAEELKQIII